MWELFKLNPSFFGILFSAIFGGAIAIIGISKQRESAVTKNTIDFEAALGNNTTYDDHVERVRFLGLDDKEGRISVARWAGVDYFDAPEAEAIRYVLNVWERAANGINKNVFDSHFLYNMYGTHVITLHDRLLPYIKRIQTTRQKKAFTNFIAMVDQWKEWRSLEPETIYHQTTETKTSITAFLDSTKFGGSSITPEELRDSVAIALPEYTIHEVILTEPHPIDSHLGVCTKFDSSPKLNQEDGDRAKRFIETTVLRVVMERHLG